MMAAGVTENLAIRTLELFVDVYANLHTGGSAPHHVDQVPLWSVKAKNCAMRFRMPNRVTTFAWNTAHRKQFCTQILDLYRKDKLGARTMDKLAEKDYKLAVITLDEDTRLNKIARSREFDTPEERWAAAGIEF